MSLKKKLDEWAAKTTEAVKTALKGGKTVDDKVFSAELERASAEINRKCPVKIDPETILEATSVQPGKKFVYRYRLPNVLLGKIDLETAGTNIFNNLLNTVKTSPDLKHFRDHQVTMVYHYRDKNGTVLFEFEFRPEDYK